MGQYRNRHLGYLLKLKRVSTARDIRYIAKQERKARTQGRVRQEYDMQGYRARHSYIARALQIAGGFLVGRSYSEIETKARYRPDWDTVWEFVMAFGPRHQMFNETKEEFSGRLADFEMSLNDWIEAGHLYFIQNTVGPEKTSLVLSCKSGRYFKPYIVKELELDEYGELPVASNPRNN